MYKTKLCLGINPAFCEDINKQLDIIKETGFEAVFFPYHPQTPEHIKYARSIGLEIQSIHAPFGGCADLWEGTDEEAEEFVRKLIDCVEMCKENEVPLMVSHAYIGFDEHGTPNERGLGYYGRVIEAADKAGIKIGFENTEGEEFLDAILTRFADHKNVGFNWDTGHEMCYNFSADMPGKYPGRLFGTHLNDNLGIKDPDGKIFWTDDLHLLPFDGIADWHNIAERLKRENYDGILTFELNKTSKPGRHENDVYAAMSPEIYIAQAYSRACRVATLLQKIKE